MAVAARGGYAGNLPTVRRARGTPSLDTLPMTEGDVISAQVARQAEAMKRYSYETGRTGRDYDPFRSGLAALWAQKGRQGRELAAMGMPLTKRYGAGDSPYGTGASFVKRYANDGGYVNNLPTVRMQGEGTFGVSDDLPPLSWQTVSDQMAQDSLDNPELSGVSLQFRNLLSNNQPLFVNNPTALTNVISDYKKAKEEALAGKRVETDLTAIRDQGMTDPRFQAVVDRIDYNDPRFSDFAGPNANPAITAPLNPASNVSVTDRLKALYGRHSLQREYNPDDGTWSVANDPSRRGGLPLDLSSACRSCSNTPVASRNACAR